MKFFDDIADDIAAISRRFHGGTRPRDIAATMAYDGSQVLVLARLRQAATRWRIPVAGGILRRVQLGWFGMEIAEGAHLGTGILFLHTVGIVIGGDSHIGDHVVFLGGNTIGSNKSGGFPRIGNHVVIGAGARILGEITIGDGAVIGANAVVLRDVPAGASAVGVPAVVRLRDEPRVAAK